MNQAERERRDAQERYRLLTEAIPQLIWRSDSHGFTTEVNARWLEYTGQALEEALGFGWMKVVHPDDFGSTVVQMARAGATGDLYQAEYRLRRGADGAYRWHLARAVPLKDREGQVLGWFGSATDIDDQKRAAEKISKESIFRKTVIKRASEGLCVCHAIPDFPFVSFSIWNDRMTEITGYTMAEINRLGWYQTVYPDPATQERAIQRMEKMREGKDLVAEEWDITRRDGTKRTLLISTSILEGFGDEVHVLAIMNDITERKWAEEKLRNSQQQLQNLFNASPLPAVLYALTDSRIIDVNDRFLEVSGFTREEVIGRMGLEIGLWHDASDRHHLVDWMRQKEVIRDFEAKVRAKSGREIDVVISAQVVEFADGPAVIVQANDVTERKRAAEALRQSEKRFRMLVESSPEAIFVQTERRFAYLNGAAVHLYGAKYPGDLLGKPVLDYLHPHYHEAVRERIRLLNEEKNPVPQIEVAILCLDGTSVPVEVMAVPIHYEGNDGALVFARDITERKRAEAERAKLQEQLRQSHKMESVGRLAGGVAHDFNNMLGVILGNVELALERVHPQEAIHFFLQEIRQAAERSANLTQQLLAFARKQPIAPKVLNLNEVVGDILKMLEPLIGENIVLTWLPEENLWPVKADPSQIDQILTNLCVNARDAISGPGKVLIQTNNLTCHPANGADRGSGVRGKYVRLVVSDNGCGMDKETLENIFEPFFTTKGIGKGTGLGLAMVHGIVRQNNGFINVNSEMGQGTTFEILFPRYVGELKQIPTEGQAQAPQGSETVLLVEDQPELLRIASLMLEELGYRTLTAGTPRAAMDLAELHAGEIHLLMTDVIMPEMNGRDLAKRLLTLYPNLKCLFMSGYTADFIASQGILDEGVRFLEKPFSMKVLAAKLSEALGKE